MGGKYVHSEIFLPIGDKITRDHVVHQKHDANGNLIGRSNWNPILDTCLYEVECSREEITKLSANIIAESMYSQCDVKADQKIVVKGQETLRKSTAGRDMCCKWKDGSTSWEKLSNPKESHPIQVIKYAIAQGIQHGPAFNW